MVQRAMDLAEKAAVAARDDNGPIPLTSEAMRRHTRDATGRSHDWRSVLSGADQAVI